MICKHHPSNGEVDNCPSCAAASPADLAIYILEEVQVDEALNPED